MKQEFQQFGISDAERIIFSHNEERTVEDKIFEEIRRDYFQFGSVCKKNEIFDDVESGDEFKVYCDMRPNRSLKLTVKRGKKVTVKSRKLGEEMYAVDFWNVNSLLKKTEIFFLNHNYFTIIYFSDKDSTNEANRLFFSSKNGESVIICIKNDDAPKILFHFSVPDGINMQALEDKNIITMLVKAVHNAKTEYFVPESDIKTLMTKIKSVKPTKEFRTLQSGFEFSPQDFSSDKSTPGFDFKISDSFNNKIDNKSSETIAEKTTPEIECATEKIDAEKDAFEPIINEQISIANEPTESENLFLQEIDKKERITYSGNVERPDCVINNANEKYLYYGDIDENGDRSGIGRTTLRSGGITYYGNYLFDKRAGFGAYYYKSGKPCYFGNWNDNKRNGMGIGYRSTDGVIHAGNWCDDKPDGMGVRFFKNGTIKEISDFTNGKRDGISLSFDGKCNLIITKWKDGEQLTERKIIDLNDF